MSLAQPQPRAAAAFPGISWDAARLAPVVLLLVAVATRFNQLGNPAIHMDEQFYLLVGDRMWSGALPYVDIWDRKPLGLFLIYALARGLSPEGVLGYQLLALGFAAATAWVVSRIASRVAGGWAAVAAGAAYLLCLPVLGGAGGQSPVFYNLFMAVAGLLIVKAGEAQDPRASDRLTLAAMLLASLAIQVKTTAAVEGLGFGLWLLWTRWRRTGALAKTATHGAIWAAAALLPTALAFGAYAAMGHGSAWLYANVTSEFLVKEPAGGSPVFKLIYDAVLIGPVLAMAALGAARLFRAGAPSEPARFLAVWTAFAVAGFFPIGHFYNHYALPMLVPLAALGAPVLESPMLAAAFMALFVGWAARFGGWPGLQARDAAQAKVGAISAAVQPYADRGCVYLRDGPDVVYVKTHACLATPYVFPEHLGIAAEAGATHASEAMNALLARRPAAILEADAPLDHAPNRRTQGMLDRALAADYRLKAVLPDLLAGRHQRLYVRRDLL